jgi:hypothetical protein
MNKIVFYIAVLIGIFLMIVYYKGSTSVISSGGSAIGNLVLFLQGRNTKGTVSGYPQG